MDTGPMYYQEEVEIGHSDSTDDLLTRMSELAGHRIMEIVANIQKGIKPVPQPTTGVTLAPKISKEMAKIDWNLGADLILRKMRALEERPGTWSTFRGERIAIHQLSESLMVNSLNNPGDIAVIDGTLLIRCQDSTLTIKEVTPSGKKRMSGAEFARGARVTNTDRFE